jgi:molybdopterin converting factor small subunit
MMKVNVLIFGPLKEVTGTNVCEVNDVRDTNEMIMKMNAMFPGLDKKKFLIALIFHKIIALQGCGTN